jgi:nucleoid-associated protein YgaU
MALALRIAQIPKALIMMNKVQITKLHNGETICASFNPEEYTINKDNNVAVQGIPGLSAPLVQFVNGNLRTLEMELFFDTWDTPKLAKTDVRTLTSQVVSLMDIDSTLHAPPILLVSWASLQLRCVLARVSQKFIMFADDGKPVRAKLSCTFNEVIDVEQEIKRLNLQTADYTKVHVVVEGDTLCAIANAYYEDPKKWRPIALMNEIDDPRAIAIGQSLVIPSLPYRDAVTHEVTV